jgi:glycosyltransferase involved in cell wall biosynthesis
VKPVISVVCPTFNSASFVVRTLESVVSQTLPPDEIIVSDDGSTDDTVACVTGFLQGYPSIRSVVIAGTHKGPGAARNSAVKRATGEWIAFIDSDDFWFPTKLEKIASAIASHPEANVFCHSEEQIHLDGSRRSIKYSVWFDSRRPLPQQLYYRDFFSPSAVTCRRSLIRDAGFFDEAIMSGVEDFDLWQKMAPRIVPVFIDETLAYYYDREGNISSRGDWKRWQDMVRLAFRYRRVVTPVGMVFHLTKVTVFFGLRGMRRLFKRNP